MFHILKAQDICALTAILLTCNLEDPGPFPTFSQGSSPRNGYLSVTQRMAALERPLAHSSGRVDWLPFLFHRRLPSLTTCDYTSRMKHIQFSGPAPPPGPGRFPLHYTKLPPKVNAGFW